MQLVEIPTDDEIHDNIVAMLGPQGAGQGRHSFAAAATGCIGRRTSPSRAAGALRRDAARQWRPARHSRGRRACASSWSSSSAARSTDLPFGVKPEPVLSSPRGEFSYIFAEAVPDGVPGHWRAQFDLTVTGTEPVEMRCTCARHKVLTETWLYQFHPF